MIIHPASSSPTALGGGNTTAPTLCQALPVPLLRESISQLARPQRRHLFLVHVTDVQTEAPAPGTWSPKPPQAASIRRLGRAPGSPS